MEQTARVPTGRQLTLRHADAVAVVVCGGGGIRQLHAGGRALLEGYAEPDLPDGARGQLLAPWPNRIRDGRYRFGERSLQLPLDEPERGNAIHGLARWMPWTITEQSEDRAVLCLELVPQPGYPFCLDLRVEYRLDPTGLTVRQSAANSGREPCPYGSGAHPYLAAGGRVDDCELTLPAATRLLSDARGLPTGRAPVAGTELDFRHSRRIGAARLDTAFTDLERDAEGMARVRLVTPAGVSELWADSGHPYLMVFSGDTLAAPRRRRGLAVEPMSCAPDAFNSGAGLRRLEPGETVALTWGVRARVDPAQSSG